MLSSIARTKPRARRSGGAGHWAAAVRNNLVGLALLLATWSVLALVYPPYVIPSPVTVLRAAPGLVGAAWDPHLLLTLKRVAAGFVLAFGAGTALGILGHMLRLMEHVNSLMTGLQVIPGTILGIILLLVLGVGDWVPIALVALLTLPTIAINTATALARRDPELEQYLLACGARPRDLVRLLYLPTLVPAIQSNLSLGFGLAIKVVVLGEYIGSQAGLGYLLNVATVHFDMQSVLAYLCVILLAGALFEIAQNLAFRAFLGKYFYPP